MMPIAYLLSGGVALRSLMPGFTYRFWRALESAIGTMTETMAMFAMIVIDIRKPT